MGPYPPPKRHGSFPVGRQQGAAACGREAPEGLDLALGQHLGQLEHGRHVLAVVGQMNVLEAVSEGEEQLSAPKDADAKASTWTRWLGARWFEVADSLEGAQSRIALEDLGKRRAAWGIHAVFAKTATKEGTTSSWAMNA